MLVSSADSSPRSPRRRPGPAGALTLAALSLLLWSTAGSSVAAGDADVPPAADATPTPTAAPARLPIADAVDGLADLDDATRLQALERLRTADSEDIPALEKFAHSNDPEVRQQVGLILKKLKRGDLAFQVTYPDGTPLADAKITIRVYQNDGVRVMNSGMPGQVLVYYNPPRNGPAQEELRAEISTDKDGRASAGRMNDGNYLVLVDAPENLPRQIDQEKIELREKSAPTKVVFKRGVTLTVTVVDPDGQPLPNAIVANIEQEGWVNNLRRVPPSQAQNYLRQLTSSTADEKGVAVLEKIGLQAVQPVVLAEGFEVAIADKMNIADGATGSLTIKMARIQPIEGAMVLKDARNNKPLSQARVLLVPSMKVNAIIGPMWFNQTAEGKIEDYIKNGASDLGTTNDKGEIGLKALPDSYHFLAFVDKNVFFSQLVLTAQSAKSQLRMNPLGRQ